MRYAILSDIHGNLPALDAVLEDIRTQSVDRILVLGDFLGDLPWPNDVIDRIRALPHAFCVQGNRDGYMHLLSEQDPEGWIYEQLAALYWNFRTLRPDNREYLLRLPKCIQIGSITMTHASTDCLPQTDVDTVNGWRFAKLREADAGYRKEDYSAWAQALLERDAVLSTFPAGVYLFGHYHIQWHARIGERLLINPGSCGMAQDGDRRAPYTLLCGQEGAWRVEERRVSYPLEEAMRSLKESSLYREAEVWSQLTLLQLRDSIELLYRFFAHIERMADAARDRSRPFSNTLWRSAGQAWISEYTRHAALRVPTV